MRDIIKDKPETYIGRNIIHTQNQTAAYQIDGPLSAIERNTFLLGTNRVQQGGVQPVDFLFFMRWQSRGDADYMRLRNDGFQDGDVEWGANPPYSPSPRTINLKSH